MLVLFALNAFLNVCWSLLFFRLHRPDWALAEVALLWLSILALVLFLGRGVPGQRLAAGALPRLGHVRGSAELRHRASQHTVRTMRWFS